ncbi:unnamed protein product [Rotaria sp. Silwood1]|nr:unnamed protein product [Rotaria sp. Silwood1]CAF1592033.1 unnamed protein product [Rotaria sp. Silwood1]
MTNGFSSTKQQYEDTFYCPRIITTTTHTLVILTRADDPIVGICHTIAGESICGSGVNYPSTEIPSDAIDGSLTTKYLNFGDSLFDVLIQVLPE